MLLDNFAVCCGFTKGRSHENCVLLYLKILVVQTPGALSDTGKECPSNSRRSTRPSTQHGSSPGKNKTSGTLVSPLLAVPHNILRTAQVWISASDPDNFIGLTVTYFDHFLTSKLPAADAELHEMPGPFWDKAPKETSSTVLFVASESCGRPDPEHVEGDRWWQRGHSCRLKLAIPCNYCRPDVLDMLPVWRDPHFASSTDPSTTFWYSEPLLCLQLSGHPLPAHVEARSTGKVWEKPS